jgi:dTMP kinase
MAVLNKFIALEGLDGSGKSAQFQLLTDYFEKKNIKYKAVHFPRVHDSPYGSLVGRFLQGEFGSVKEVDPYLVSLLFALDRREASTNIIQWLYQGYLVLVDRFVYSNVAFQCGKISDPLKKELLRNWILDLEFTYNRLPRPIVSLFLDVPIQFIYLNLSKRRETENRDYLNGKADIHEIDLELQEQVQREYLHLSEYYDDFEIVNCSTKDKNEVLPTDEIHSNIVRILTMKNLI